MNNGIRIFSYERKSASGNSDREIIASVKEYLADTDAEITVIRDEYGKPYVSGIDGIFVSVTHDEGICIVAVAPFPVGIDMERWDRRVKNRYRLSKRYFCEDEAAFLSENDSERAFVEMWVKKEALSKLIGKGVPCMKEKSVFSDDIEFVRLENYDGYIAYCVRYIG